MANTVLAKGGTYGHPSPSARHMPYLEEVYLSFVSGSGTVEAGNVATGATYDVMALPANTLVMAAGIEVLVVDSAGNSGTVALSDVAGTNSWVAAAAPTALGQMAQASTDPKVYGKLDSYPAPLGSAQAATYLRVTVGTGAINAKFRVWAVLLDTTTYQTNIIN